MAYVIVQAPPEAPIGYQGYGAAAALWEYKGPEAIISGPYETGKTLAALFKLHALLCKYAGARALAARATYASLVSSAVVTYEQKVLPHPPGHHLCPITRYGGERPTHYAYPNGSRLLLGGLDRAEKFLSAEFDFIYLNQAEEIRLDQFEQLVGRATGRAGNAPYTQVLGDCNPSHPNHWILQRPRLQLFESKHKDNPALWDRAKGQWTEQGKRTMAALDSLTGLRYKRGRLGLWVAAEGQVYDYNPDAHLIDRFTIPASWPRYRSVDFGYVNPFCCQWWATDEDGRLYLYRELYMSGRTVRRHAEQIKALSEGESFVATIADHDAEDRATLAENGIGTIPADKRISVGIEKVQERLKLQGDGRPRLMVLRDSLIEPDESRKSRFLPLSTVDEFGAYTYPNKNVVAPQGSELPQDAHNHAMDAMRYMVMALDGRAKVSVTWL